MKKEKDIVGFVSTAQIPANNPLADVHKSVAVGMLINYKTGEIVNVSSVFASDVLRDFMISLLIHRNVHEEPLEDLLWTIKEYLNCATQKAVCVCIKKNVRAYAQWCKERDIDCGEARNSLDL